MLRIKPFLVIRKSPLKILFPLSQVAVVIKHITKIVKRRCHMDMRRTKTFLVNMQHEPAQNTLSLVLGDLVNEAHCPNC